MTFSIRIRSGGKRFEGSGAAIVESSRYCLVGWIGR